MDRARAIKDYERAIGDFTKVIELRPGIALDYYSRAQTYVLMSGPADDRAVADLTEAIRLKKDAGGPYFLRARAYEKNKDYDRAIADFTKVVEFNPDTSTVVKLTDEVVFTDGNASASLGANYWLEGLDGVAAYLSRGRAYQAKGDHGRAIADFSKIVTQQPKWSKGYCHRADAYLAKDENDHAIADFTACLKMNPRHPEAYNGRAKAYRRKGDYGSAIADYYRGFW